MTQPAPPGYRIGALLTIPRTVINQRVWQESERRGFTDISAAHLVALQSLAPEGMRLTALAARAGMAKQSMGYLVHELERAGYLERVPDPADGRAKIIKRTERGWAFQRLAGEVVRQVEEEWVALLGEADVNLMKDILNRLCAALGYRYEGSVAEATRRSAGRPAGSSY